MLVRFTATCQEFGYKTIVNTSDCYKIHPTALTKTGASKECQQEGGHLIRITSSHMLASLIVDIDYLGKVEFIYLTQYKSFHVFNIFTRVDLRVPFFRPQL